MIRRSSLPAHALSARYARAGAYVDCYATEVAREVSHAQFVEAFYTTWLFRLERLVLRVLLRMASTDDEARELAHGERTAFAAWTVEERALDQLLVCDFQGKTRSWLMVERAQGDTTRLYFGTVITPRIDRKSGRRAMSFGFRALLPFHRFYSRALLHAARSRLSRPGS